MMGESLLDTMDGLGGLGAAGCFCLAVLYMVFQFLSKGKKGCSNEDLSSELADCFLSLTKRLEEMMIVLRDIQVKNADLHKWHDVDDPLTGAKKWYVQSSLEAAVVKLSENIGEQTKVLGAMMTSMERTEQAVTSLRTDMK